MPRIAVRATKPIVVQDDRTDDPQVIVPAGSIGYVEASSLEQVTDVDVVFMVAVPAVSREELEDLGMVHA